MLHSLGKSTSGWSNIGISLSDSMHRELDPAMTTVATYLTDGIAVMTKIQKGTDVVLSMAGSTTDAALVAYKANPNSVSIKDAKAKIVASLEQVSVKAMAKIAEFVDKFIELIRPALEQIKKWLVSFGEKIQSALEQFGTTVDRVQKIFDQAMAKLSMGAGGNLEDMIYNTYTLFDTDNSGLLQASDIESVANLYGISALQGNKAKQLFEKYDGDGKGGLDPKEYTLFVHDPSIPGVMSLVLRTYAKKLATVSGNVASAKMRDEAAVSVVDYLTLVCAKNMTKVAWVSQALTNGSLPIQFTADVLIGFAANLDNPNSLTLIDVGAVIVGEMMRLNPATVVEALKLLSNPAFWESEGFNLPDQPDIVEQVVRWVVQTPQGPEALRSGVVHVTSQVDEDLPKAAKEVTQARVERYLAKQRTGSADSDSSNYQSKASQALRSGLLAGMGAGAAGSSKEADATVNQGQPALPATLEFASWLAANASETSKGFLQDCMDYSGQSSGALESFANQVNGMIKKIQNFLDIMSKYASPRGIDRLLAEAGNFSKEAVGDIVKVVEDYVESELHALDCEVKQATGQPPCTEAPGTPDFPLELSGAFNFVTHTLAELKSVLPVVINDLKFAKKEVSAVSSALNGVMDVLGAKAPPIFNTISSLYSALWIAYFTLFALLLVSTLIYAFWASGFMGGPSRSSSQEYVAPTGFRERLAACFNSCSACCKGCANTQLCFWSVTLLMEVIVLLCFIVAIVICIIGGIQAFLSAGCNQVYILSDTTICTTALHTMKKFLPSFWSGESIKGAVGMALDDTCKSETLLTCHLISQEVSSSVLTAIIGSLLAAVFSFQLIIESAVLHEYARWRMMMEEVEDKEAKML